MRLRTFWKGLAGVLAAALLVPGLFMVAASAASARAADRPVLKNEQLTIRYDSGDVESAERFQRLYPAVKRDVEAALGWKLRARPTVNLVGDTDTFEKMARGPLVAGFAVPSQHLIVINIDTVVPQLFILSDTFKHELCHLLLHENIESRRLPKWLDEGVCQWVSGDIGKVLALGKYGLSIDMISLSRNPPSLRQVSGSFDNGGLETVMAYRASLSAVKFIAERYGREGLLAILEELKMGQSIDGAVKKAVGKSLSSLEFEWHRDLKRQTFWIVWIGQNVEELLFAFGGFLVFVAFIKLIFRKRRYGREEELDL